MSAREECEAHVYDWEQEFLGGGICVLQTSGRGESIGEECKGEGGFCSLSRLLERGGFES